MRRRGWFLLALALVAGGIVGVVLGGSSLDAGGSTFSRGGTGWLAARIYLGQRGAAPQALDRPPAAAEAGRGTLVLAFPWQTRALEVQAGVVLSHLAHGGDVVIAYAGEPVPSVGERMLLGALGVDTSPLPAPPLAPWRWREESARPWQLRAAPRWEGARGGGLVLRRPRWLPELQRESALLLGPQGRVVAASWRHRKGRVTVLPAELLCNARLAGPAHAALLETLHGGLAGPWRFDEYHHGFGAGEGEDVAPTAARRGFDLLLLQLLLIYAAAALALARRLGPAWRESPPLAGNAGSFLLRLGSLHHRLGHHAEGAALLLRRARELDRRLGVAPRLTELAARGDAAALVEVGQAVARLQRR